MPDPKKVIIIGGGLGGLGTAILLAKDGHDVTIYEKNEQLGGRASQLIKDWFVFDRGPSRYLMPDVFEDFFKQIGEDVHEWLDLKQLSPSYRIFAEDRTVDMTSNPDEAAAALEAIEPGVTPHFLDYLKKSAEQYRLAIPFVYKNYDSILDFLSRDVAKKGLRINIFSWLARYVESFFHTPLVQKIMMYTLVFLGTSPYDAPALYSLMTYVDFSMGVFYPLAGPKLRHTPHATGIYAITTALSHIAHEHGVKVHLHTPVTQILSKDGVTTGILLSSGAVVDADIVVCNADQARAETHLLAPVQQTYSEKYWSKKTFAPSAFILYLGIKGRVPELEHHNLIFSDDRKQNFAEIFESHTMPTDPSIYICAPSKTDPHVAPHGDENLFILVPAPTGISLTDAQAQKYEIKVLDLIEKVCKIELQSKIIVRERFTVDDFQTRYNARDGTALGLAHTLRQTALLRPNNISKKIKNLYYVGHNTNPGIGMPMVLISALLVQKRVRKKK